MQPLAVIGNVNVDLILGPATPWPKAGTEIIVEHDELRVGGQAGNSALAWQALGVDFQIAANVGNDQFGRWLRDEIGMRAAKWPVSSQATTLSVGITHPDGERTFFTTRGHLPRLSLEDVLSVLGGPQLAGGWVLLTGSFLTEDLTKDYEKFFGWADSHGIAVALDTGWPMDGWTEANRQAVTTWLSHCSLALFNEIETTTLAGHGDPGEAARKLQSGMKRGATVVVKRGPHGALAIGPDGELAAAEAPSVEVVDTIGAGDVFNAAFLASLARWQPLATCLAAGVETASRAVSTRPRSYGGTFSREETMA